MDTRELSAFHDKSDKKLDSHRRIHDITVMLANLRSFSFVISKLQLKLNVTSGNYSSRPKRDTSTLV